MRTAHRTRGNTSAEYRAWPSRMPSAAHSSPGSPCALRECSPACSPAPQSGRRSTGRPYAPALPHPRMLVSGRTACTAPHARPASHRRAAHTPCPHPAAPTPQKWQSGTAPTAPAALFAPSPGHPPAHTAVLLPKIQRRRPESPSPDLPEAPYPRSPARQSG